MDCFEFRRLKLVAPRETTSDQVRHMSECARCAAFADELDGLDRGLQAAMLVPVPEGLADRILLRLKLRGRRWFGEIALAAMLLLGLGVSLWQTETTARSELGKRMIAHVLSEPHVFTMEEDIPGERVAGAMASVGGLLRGTIGNVTFMEHCKTLDPGATHLVVRTAYGSASVVLLPHSIQRSTVQVADQGLVAIVFPAQRGSISVVAQSAGTADMVGAIVRNALRWADEHADRTPFPQRRPEETS